MDNYQIDNYQISSAARAGAPCAPPSCGNENEILEPAA
jgi:hypothetical protein